MCVLNCCRVINNLLHVADNDGSEARGEQLSQYKPVRIYGTMQPCHAPMALQMTHGYSYKDLLLAVRLSASDNFCSTACVVHCDEVLLCHTVSISTVTSESVRADWADALSLMCFMNVATAQDILDCQHCT